MLSDHVQCQGGKGIIFNIQKFCIHDGPGIRTTIFLKGCPLKCRWCANPESQELQMQLVYDCRKCVQCGACVSACPHQAIELADGKILFIQKNCKKCYQCVRACATKALALEGSEYTVDELMREILKDQAFYEKSGGGVTLSGGEPLLQEEFVFALLQKLKEEKIHITVETCGQVRPAFFLRALPFIDLFYFDIKHPDSVKHRQKTGVSNELILFNLEQAVKNQKAVVARLPMIPDYNDDLNTALAYSALLKRLGITKAHLLPFHQLGLGKYERMHIDYDYADTPNMLSESLVPYRDLLASTGIDAQIGG